MSKILFSMQDFFGGLSSFFQVVFFNLSENFEAIFSIVKGTALLTKGGFPT